MKLTQLFKEIRINKPINYSVTNEEGRYRIHIHGRGSWDVIANKLEKLGYRWVSGLKPTQLNPYDTDSHPFNNNGNYILLRHDHRGKLIFLNPVPEDIKLN